LLYDGAFKNLSVTPGLRRKRNEHEEFERGKRARRINLAPEKEKDTAEVKQMKFARYALQSHIVTKNVVKKN
jgi:hypothetical protein